MRKTIPSMDAWLREAKAQAGQTGVGMYLIHNGVVRATHRAQARNGAHGLATVAGRSFSYDEV